MRIVWVGIPLGVALLVAAQERAWAAAAGRAEASTSSTAGPGPRPVGGPAGRDQRTAGALWSWVMGGTDENLGLIEDPELMASLTADDGWGRAATPRDDAGARLLAELALQPGDTSARYDAEYQKRIVAAISRIADLDLLERLARRAPADAVRRAALERLGGKTGVLREAALDDPSSWVRSRAWELLNDGAATAAAARRCAWKAARLSAIEAVGDRVVLAELARPTETADVRLAALGRLGQVDTAVRQDLDPVVRRAFAESVGDASSLLLIARDEEELEGIRLTAVGRLEDQPALTSLARGDASRVVRLAATRRLLDLTQAREWSRGAERERLLAVRALLEPAGTAAPRGDSCRGLADVAPGAVAPMDAAVARRLTEALRGCSDASTRKRVAAVLGDADALLAAAVADPAPDVRAAAAERLRAVGSRADLYDLLFLDPEVARVPWRDWLSGLSQRQLRSLALSHAQAGYRALATERLEQSALLRTLALGDPSDSVRSAAVAALSDEGVRRQVAQGDQSDLVRRAATVLLGGQADLLRAALHDPSDSVRDAAALRLPDSTALLEAAQASEPLTTRLRAIAALRVRLGRVGSGSAEGAGIGAVLADLVASDDDPEVRLAALAGVSDPGLRAEWAAHHRDRAVRRLAVNGLMDQERLAALASAPDEDGGPALRATLRLESRDRLLALAQQAPRLALRLAAVRRLGWLGANVQLGQLVSTTRDAAVHELALRQISNPSILEALAAHDPGAAALAARRRSETERASRLQWGVIPAAGLDYSSRSGVSGQLGAALLTSAGEDSLCYAGPAARVLASTADVGADVGLAAGCIVPIGAGEWPLPLPLGVGAFATFRHSGSGGAGGRGAEALGIRAELRIAELVRISYARLEATDRPAERPYDEWTAGIQVPLPRLEALGRR